MLGDASGAVIRDTYGTLYWLVAIGSAASWHLRGTRVLCELIDEATYLGVPPVDWREGPRIHWRVPLGPDRYLTDTRLLWEALAAADHAELGPRVEGRQLGHRCRLPTDEPVLVGEEGGSLGGAVYACPRHAPEYQRTDAVELMVALRRGREEAGADSLIYKPCQVPEHIARGVHMLTFTFGLQYVALDFLVNPEGTWYLIDVNPNGQWAFIPDLREPITRALADLLERPNP